MITRHSLQKLVDHLPNQPRGRFHEDSFDPAFTIAMGKPSGYVWPDVEVDEGLQQSSILLVTAPGAMGKSAAARAIASTINAPFIDLAKVPIGGDSLTGLLTRVLGWEQAPDFVKDLRSGRVGIVLDSLDEAQLSSGQLHFTAFLANVVELLRGGAAKSQVIILGRRDTIETATLVLADLGIQPQQAEVAPLNFDQSSQLINLVLDDIHMDGARYRTHREHATPFAMYRDRVLLDMATALGSDGETIEECWVEVGDFLGYPPVLLVMGRHLIVENPGALNSQPHSHGGMDSRGALLLEVTEEIMSRESEKVRAQMCGVLGIPSDDPKRDLLYTREEQVVRITSYLTGQALTIPLPGSLTSEETVIYQDQIVTFVPDHPFLRGREIENVVFSDYLKAYAVVSDALAIQRVPALVSDAQSIGPFFSHFVHAMAQKSDEGRGNSGSAAVVPERIIDALVKSFGAGARQPYIFFYNDRGEGAGSLLIAEDPLPEESRNVPSHLEFIIEESSGLIEMSSPLGRGLIVSSDGLSISSATDETVLGPDLVLIVGELVLDGKRATIVSTPKPRHAPNGGVLIISRGRISHDHDLRLIVFPPDALGVLGPDLWHQWHPYRIEIPGMPQVVPYALSWQVVFGLRRILSAFHGSSGSDPTVGRDKLERFAVGSNSTFSATLESMIELGVIVRESSIYRLRLNRLSEFGISYAAIRGEDFETALEGLKLAALKTSSMQASIVAAKEES